MINIEYHFSQSNTPNISECGKDNTRPVYLHTCIMDFNYELYVANTYALYFDTGEGGFFKEVVILSNLKTMRPQWVYFATNNFGDGIWRKWGKCEKTIDKALVVYVARKTYTMYPRRGVYVRNLFFANDYCDAKGDVWRPTKDDVVVMKHSTLAPPKETSMTCWKRFISPCWCFVFHEPRVEVFETYYGSRKKKTI